MPVTSPTRMVPLNIFDSFMGLPMHPLVVHFAVVLLPLAALGLIVLMFVRPWRERYAGLALVSLAAGTFFAFVAKESGEQLEKRQGKPGYDHGEWGAVLPWIALLTLAIAAGWWVLEHRSRRRNRRSESAAAAQAAGGSSTARHNDVANAAREVVAFPMRILTALACLAVVILTVIVGHTGAKSAWADVMTQPAGQASASATDSSSSASSATPSASGSGTAAAASSSSSSGSTYTMAQVKQHNSASSCWAVIHNNVYDLTNWINAHPGGPDPIKGLCGTDGTSAFDAQHGTQSKPNNELAKLKIGALQG